MGLFRRIFGKSDSGLIIYGSSENPRPLRRVKAAEEDLRVTMARFRELKGYLRPCVKQAEKEALEAEIRAEYYREAFSRSLLGVVENGGNYWKDRSSYPETSELWSKCRNAAKEKAKALKDLRHDHEKGLISVCSTYGCLSTPSLKCKLMILKITRTQGDFLMVKKFNSWCG